MIRAAIDELAEDGGSTASSIEKLIRKKHSLTSGDVSENMQPALEKGLSVGKIEQVGKCYRNVLEPERPKKLKPLKLKMPKLLKVSLLDDLMYGPSVLKDNLQNTKTFRLGVG